MIGGMDAEPRRVLIVANRTSSTPALLDLVKQRAHEAPHHFTLLVPDAPDRKAADWTLESALPLLRRAAGSEVEGIAGGPDPYEAIHEAVLAGSYDEIVISTLSKRSSRWLRRDLPTRVQKLVGVPVTVISAEPGFVPSYLPQGDGGTGFGGGPSGGIP
jgi:hypothetical protein